MSDKRNYQLELDKILKEVEKEEYVPRLFLHSCCAPCSSYVLEYLSNYFEITIFYYNPNISEAEEYNKRVEEQKRLISEINWKHPVSFIEGPQESSRFFESVKGLEDKKEGGERCFLCYKIRLEKTKELAEKLGFDYFTTTLSISPKKNAEKLNEVGLSLEGMAGPKYLVSDFKKKGGYLRSVELSREHQLYRQNYCGCVFSKKEAEQRELL